MNAFLKASMLVRFADISPYEFEDFIAEMMETDGFEVERTPYSGDFGADLVAKKDGLRTVVQVKRYQQDNPVGVADVNQVIGARSYYKADRALMITTSTFTSSALEAARAGDVMLWDWQKLSTYIGQVYFEGRDYYDHFRDDMIDVSGEERFELHYHKLDNETVYEGHECIGVKVGLENLTGQNVFLHLEFPMVVTKKGKQVNAIGWQQHLFESGMLISGATCEVGCYFPKAQLPEVKPGDRLIVRLHVRGEDQSIVLDQKIGLPISGCYFVTFCHGRQSIEYRQLTCFRDQILMQWLVGRCLVHCYYFLSPAIIRYVKGKFPGYQWLHMCMLLSIIIAMQISTQTPNKSQNQPQAL